MNKKTAVELCLIVVGSFLFGMSVNLFVIANDLGEGGVTGITIILYYLYEWSPSVISFLLNGILILVGYKFLDKKTMIYTIISVVVISLTLHLTEEWHINSDEVLLNAAFGGLFSGIGLGLILRAGGTSAGSTILARMTQKYLGWNVSYGLLFFDLIVVFASCFIIGIENLMITVLMLYVCTKVMDFIIEGMNVKKGVTIVTDYPEKIADEVVTKMARGVTVYSGYGYYTKKTRDILYIVISKQELMELKKIVRAMDKHAFISVHDIKDVFGEGFLDIEKS